MTRFLRWDDAPMEGQIEPGRGGHFGAWEQPAIFVDEVRAAARSCSRWISGSG